jgi:hypothetical protein
MDAERQPGPNAKAKLGGSLERAGAGELTECPEPGNVRDLAPGSRESGGSVVSHGDLQLRPAPQRDQPAAALRVDCADVPDLVAGLGSCAQVDDQPVEARMRTDAHVSGPRRRRAVRPR